MKTSIKLFALGMILMGFGVSVNAQVSASAPTSATIVTPISITKTVDMNFGNVAVQGSTAGTVVLATDNSRSRTAGVTLPVIAGIVTAAQFTVGGVAGYTYAITLPGNLLLTRQSGTEQMTVNAFTSDPTTTGTIGAGGTETLRVGATLNVAGGQVAGIYENATGFSVTVNYN
jgi:hypothetical protein